ncbi:MAG: DUF2933 domain-containing protein [Gammaproteobacteria bacterium]|nr:MAG: DUF2933 domain-containing protein [Gammaproteobacteria bacterium]
MHHEYSDNQDLRRPRRASMLIFLAFGVIAAYFLITEHRAHLFGYLPFALLAACPLLHVFHHRGHGGHGGSADGNSGRAVRGHDHRE